MNKDLDRHRCLAADAANFVERTFAGEHDALNAQLLGSGNRLAARHRHLRAGMNGQIGANGANQPHQTQVLDKHRIDASSRDLPHECFDLDQLAGEDQRVERDVALEAASMQFAHELWQIGDIKILGPRAGIKTGIESEIDRIRAVLDCRANTIAVAGRGEQLGANRRTARHR